MPTPPPALPAPDEPLLLPAPPAPLLLAAPESRWKKNAKPISAIAVAAFLVLAFAIGWFLHHRRAEAAEQSNDEERDTLELVTVVPAKHSTTLSEMLLPGSLAPITEASLYARASGYVRHRYVDIGDEVRRGQVLAEIESPELDQQLAQGQAAVAQARQQLNQTRAAVGDAQARVDLGRVTVARYETLLAQDSIARQDVDVQRQIYQSALSSLASTQANVGAAEENVRAAVANERRLVALQQYEKLRAPFDGVITERNVDEGALISGAGASLVASSGTSSSSIGSSSGSSGTGLASGSSGTTGTDSGSGGSGGGTSAGGSGSPLYRIAQVDRLRVYVTVPQENAGAIQLGSNAAVFIQQFPERFTGRVVRTARALDPSSRTLLTEVQVGNDSRALMPGMYAQVRFASERSNPPLLVPGEAVITRADGTTVALLQPLGDDDRQKLAHQEDARCARRIHLQPVTVGRDYGTQVEIARGLRPQDFLVLNPGDTATEGAVMLPRLKPDDDAPGGGAAPASGAGKGQQKSADGKDSGGAKGGAKAGGKGDRKEDAKQAKEQEAQAREHLRSTCIEEQAQAAQAGKGDDESKRPAPAGASPPASRPGASQAGPGGPSDREPVGIQSPSLVAPTQGSKGSSGKGGAPGNGAAKGPPAH